MTRSHNHGPRDGRGLDCPEHLVGACLVVIDPEDREQVERLWISMLGSLRGDSQAALREFANPTPPKPDEPTGRYAVVSADGLTWVRAAWSNERPWNKIGTDIWADYANLAAVRVLSEGVTA